MRRVCMLVVLLVLVGCGSRRPGTPDQAAAIQLITEKLGGRTEGEPLIEKIDFTGTSITDADLEVVKQFPELKRLDLRGTQVTDAALAHLTGLTQLEYLRIGNTRVTEAGLQPLRAARPGMLIER